jgi:uncharacterized protein (TIGR02996 family)
MTPEEVLLHAIRDNLDDDLPRFAYADWCEEEGDLDRAEFVRVECALAHMDSEDPDRAALFRRDLALIAAHKEAWFGPIRKDCSFWECRRGFLDEITTDSSVFLRHAPAVCPRHPLRYLRLGLMPGDLEALAASPHLAWVRRLDLSGHVGGDRFLELLARSRHVRRLEHLQMASIPVGPAGVRALAESPHLGHLRHLSLPGAQIGLEGVRALLESPLLVRLEGLSLSGRHGTTNTAPVANIGSEGVVWLASCPRASRLRSLNLCNNRLDDAALFALAASPYLDELRELGLYLHEHGDEASSAVRERFGARLHQRWWQ